MKFHEKLYELRKTEGMTQSDLSEKLNVSRQAVSRWEMGTATPDVENLIAISDLFNVTLDELLRDGSVPERPPQPKPEAPRYWDYVPSKWWLWLVLAGVAYACCYIWPMLYAFFPGSADTINDVASSNVLITLLAWLFGPLGCLAMVKIFPWISIACLIIGFTRWQNAKN